MRRRSFKEEDIWRVVYYRFASLEHFDHPVATYSQISKRTGIHHGTVREFLRRFENNGNQVFMGRRYNGGTSKISFE